MAQKIKFHNLKYRFAFQPVNKQRGWWAFENKIKAEQDAKKAMIKKINCSAEEITDSLEDIKLKLNDKNL
jgi:hypothetical protein